MKKLLLSIALMLTALTVSAYDFEVDGIYYEILDPENRFCGVTYIDYDPIAGFNNSNSYTGNVYIPDEVMYDNSTYIVTSILPNAFANCSNLISVTGGGACLLIANGAFYGCTDLTSVTIPGGVDNIGFNAFNGCSSLTSVTIPYNVWTIEDGAFQGCSSLTSVTILEGVSTIGDGAFQGCSNLTNVTIPESVESIGRYAFYGCSNLVSVTMLGSTPCSMGLSYNYDGVDYFVGAFDECASLETIYVPFGSSSSYKSADGWSAYADIIVEKGTSLVDGISYTNYMDTKADVNYTRTFNNTNWQPWYVPFDMTLTSDLMEDFAFAKIEGVVIEDQNTADVSDDATFISIVRLPEGSVIKGNVPYFVQAKSTGEKTISVENTTVKAAESFSFSVNSASNVFTFTGIYEPRTSTAEDCNAWYYFSGGQFCQPGRAGITLKAMRFYMTIAERADNPYATASAGGSKVIGIREVGDGATDIDTTPAYLVAPVDEAVYDLMGRRVSNPQHGLYIVNGQKRFIP